MTAQVEVWSGFVTHDAGPRPILAAGYLVATVAVAWHRIAPVSTLTVVLSAAALLPSALGIASANGLTWFVTAFGTIVSAGYHARRPLVALVVTLGLLAACVLAAKGIDLDDIAYAWLIAGACWLGGRAVASRTARAELSEQRAALAEQQAQWRAAAAVAEERLRIAREMHDVISHSISVMTLHASGVRRLLRPDQTEERAALEAVERTGRESLAEMHRTLTVLRSAEEGGRGPAPGLDRVSELLDAAGRAGLEAELTVTGERRPLPPGVDLAAYRIVQEAVTNVLRHARARRLDCIVGYGAACVELDVVDDGSGPSTAEPGGHGLAGMRERAALYSGMVDAGPRPGGGYAVHAVLSVPTSGPAPPPATATETETETETSFGTGTATRTRDRT